MNEELRELTLVATDGRSDGWTRQSTLKKLRRAGVLEKLIVKMREEQPHIQPVDIARSLCCTRQYVSLVLLAHHLTTRTYANRYCVDCGVQVTYGAQHCMACYIAGQHKKHYVKVVCVQCFRIFERRQQIIRQAEKRGAKYVFCGRKCFGRYMGLHFGTGTDYQRKRQDERKALSL